MVVPNLSTLWQKIVSLESVVARLASSLTYALLTGELGVVNKRYPPGDVRRYGAVGDGVTNDRDALNYAFSQNSIVYLEPNKTYKCNNGFYMNPNQKIIANGATILIDDDFAATGDFAYGFIRYKSGSASGSYELNELNFDFRCSKTIRQDGNAYYLILPTGFTTLILNKVKAVTLDGLQTPIHLVMLVNGTNVFRDSQLINNNKGSQGGCLWLNNTSSNDAVIVASNSRFYNACSDEVLAIYGPGGAIGSFTACQLENTNAKLLKNTLLMAVYDDSNNQYNGPYRQVTLEFNDCKINGDYDPANVYQNSCLIGVGSSNFNKRITLMLNNCNIKSDSPNAVFSARSCISNLSTYDYPYNAKVIVNGGSINAQGPISGAYHNFQLDSTKPSAPAMGVSLKGVDVVCQYAVIDIPNTQSDAIKAKIEDCIVRITNALAVVHSRYHASLHLGLFDSRVIADASIPVLNVESTTPNANIPMHSAEFVSYKRNVLNNAQLADTSTYTALN